MLPEAILAILEQYKADSLPPLKYYVQNLKCSPLIIQHSFSVFLDNNKASAICPKLKSFDSFPDVIEFLLKEILHNEYF